jgi:hypothetical protein
MTDTSIYQTGLSRSNVGNPDLGQLPVISTDLDAVRSYQWEIKFDIATMKKNNPNFPFHEQSMVLAAKTVTGLSYSFADIEVHRMNDKVFYPGKISQEEVTVTFDNLLDNRPGIQFYEYLSTIFDMRTGFYSTGAGGTYKGSMSIMEFDGAGRIKNVIDLKGVYPKSFSKGEKNYSTSEFDTFEVKFRYDFMNIRSSTAQLMGPTT